MLTIKKEELEEKIKLHQDWLDNIDGGERLHLKNYNLEYCNLENANIKNANIEYCNLENANLKNANLKNANLKYCNLENANLENANLKNTNLKYCNLKNAYLEYANFYNLSCPEEGAFIGWKKANDKIIKLQITENALRSSATSYKCRCSEALVLEIEDGLKETASDYDKNFIYKVGEIVKVEDFNPDRWVECGKGIHFFMNKQNAINY